MTTPHRATLEQWEHLEQFPTDIPHGFFPCILELRARVEALEKAQRPQQDRLDRLIPSDCRSLVERVADAISAGDESDRWYEEARDAVQAVARALIEWHDSDQVVHTAYEAAKWLEREASQ